MEKGYMVYGGTISLANEVIGNEENRAETTRWDGMGRRGTEGNC